MERLGWGRARGGRGRGLRAKSQASAWAAGWGWGETGGGERDERTLWAWHCHEVSVPKKQRLEEAGDHQGHTASPGAGEQGAQASPLLPGVLPL